jgi:hypothetical protein
VRWITIDKVAAFWSASSAARGSDAEIGDSTLAIKR